MVSSALLASPRPPALLVCSGPRSQTHSDVTALYQGQILLESRTDGLSGGTVTASMYLPASPAALWPQLTDYPRWVEYFPNIIRSEVITSQGPVHRLYQVGRKAFLAIAAQVEIYLKVYERAQRSIQFRLERGTFKDFAADLTLQAWGEGTLLTYTVQATPLIPVPGFLVEQGMRQDLPANMATLRQILCR